MDPYQILGLSQNATHDEIKKAYRKLVMQYHPDKNSSAEANDRVRLINAAYEILSDPVRRINHHQPACSDTFFDEDPIEAYKREFKRKRWEREQEEKAREKARREQHEVRMFKFMRTMTYFILAFALSLVADDMLPRKIYHEVPMSGWQEREGGRRSQLASHVETPNFYLPVPHQFHLAYPYYTTDRPPITISVTPVFNVPRDVRCTLDNERWYFEILGTIHADAVKLPWLLVVSSLYVAASKFSKLSYSLCGVPALLLAAVVLIMWL
jgi:DnaJ-domain-containing protein 1